MEQIRTALGHHRGRGRARAGAPQGTIRAGLEEYGRRAARFSELLDASDFADFANFTVDTDEVSVPDVAERVMTAASDIGWHV